MLRLTMYLLCLIAALLGTPLRQAEAANDFARTLGELGEGHVIESVDGGVGDDVEVSILKGGDDTQSLPSITLLSLAEFCFPPLFSAISLPITDEYDRADMSGSFPIDSARRLAWLQRFLF